MKHLSKITAHINQLKLLFTRSWLFRAVCLCFFILVMIILVFHILFSNQKLQFTFATERSCINSLTLLPKHQKKTTNNFELFNDNHISIFKYPILSKKICIKAKTVPQENKNFGATLALLGNPLIKRNILINVPEYPKAENVFPEKSFISVAQPLEFKLSKVDSFFSYELSVDSKKTKCVKTDLTNISCDTASLKLKHANTYKFSLSRIFKGHKVSTLAEAKIPTVAALNIVSTSISNNQTVYDNPKTIEIITDRSISSFEDVSLIATDSKPQNLEIESKHINNKLTIVVKNSYKRGVSYRLNIKNIISTDRRSLELPLAINFYISKGPVVKRINIGDRSTAISRAIIVSFDQALQPNQNLANYINLSINNQPQSLTIKQDNNRIILTTNKPLPKCTKFIVNVAPGLASNYGIVSDTSWNHSSRTSCYVIQSIGISVKGRAINAYRFGSGQNAVMYIANLHGNEANTKYLMDKWINELEGNPDKIPLNRSIIVVPSINPDGLSSQIRLNANGIDLNRNFPAINWKSGITLPSGQFAPAGGGSEALSEPESKAIASYINTINPRLVMSYHSKGPVVVGNDSGQANSLASLYASKTGYPFRTNANIGNYFNYDTTGALEDWLHDKQNKPTILVELSNRYSDEFSRNITAMWLMAQSL